MASSSAVVYFSPRMVSGLLTQSGVSVSDQSKLIAWLPSAQQAMGWVTIDGKRHRVEWEPVVYKFLQFVANVKLGGPNAATLPDVILSVDTSIENAAEAVSQVNAVAQQAQANAEALAATVDVIRTDGIPGADQIPDVVLTVQ